jgi:hypothetical protein
LYVKPAACSVSETFPDRGFWKWRTGNSTAYETWIRELANPTAGRIASIPAEAHLNCWEAVNYLLFQLGRLNKRALETAYAFTDKQAGAVDMYTRAAGAGHYSVHPKWPGPTSFSLGAVVGLGCSGDPLHHVLLVVEALAGKPVLVAHLWSSTGGHLDVCTLESLYTDQIDETHIWRLS